MKKTERLCTHPAGCASCNWCDFRELGVGTRVRFTRLGWLKTGGLTTQIGDEAAVVGRYEDASAEGVMIELRHPLDGQTSKGSEASLLFFVEVFGIDWSFWLPPRVTPDTGSRRPPEGVSEGQIYAARWGEGNKARVWRVAPREGEPEGVQILAGMEAGAYRRLGVFYDQAVLVTDVGKSPTSPGVLYAAAPALQNRGYVASKVETFSRGDAEDGGGSYDVGSSFPQPWFRVGAILRFRPGVEWFASRELSGADQRRVVGGETAVVSARSHNLFTLSHEDGLCSVGFAPQLADVADVVVYKNPEESFFQSLDTKQGSYDGKNWVRMDPEESEEKYLHVRDSYASRLHERAVPSTALTTVVETESRPARDLVRENLERKAADADGLPSCSGCGARGRVGKSGKCMRCWARQLRAGNGPGFSEMAPLASFDAPKRWVPQVDEWDLLPPEDRRRWFEARRDQIDDWKLFVERDEGTGRG